MEETDNKTIMCSVFFLDIVGYSRKSVTGQISLKDRFNAYISDSIHDVPLSDRIILDTGDGAVINFLGDIEDALKAAFSLRESLLAEDPGENNPLHVRMGINLGPVRLVRDINGQPNIVGDGINVAQRVMSFAETSQILVSRSYYDAVSRVSPQYAKMFLYQGSRTDKHIREHVVYAMGYPSDVTTQRSLAKPLGYKPAHNQLTVVLQHAKSHLDALLKMLAATATRLLITFRQAEAKQRALYIAVVSIPLILLFGLVTLLLPSKKIEIAQQAAPLVVLPAPQEPPAAAPVMPSPEQDKAALLPEEPLAPQREVSDPSKPVSNKRKEVSKNTAQQQARPVVKQPRSQVRRSAPVPVVTTPAIDPSIAIVLVKCRVGTEVFLDGTRKGRITGQTLTIRTTPGKHTVIVSHPSTGVFSQRVSLAAGKLLQINPDSCN